jgi:hypothetical protein
MIDQDWRRDKNRNRERNKARSMLIIEIDVNVFILIKKAEPLMMTKKRKWSVTDKVRSFFEKTRRNQIYTLRFPHQLWISFFYNPLSYSSSSFIKS